MTVNVRGTWQAICSAVPLLRRNGGGKIVNVSSATVFKGSPLLLHYVTSKAAIVGMTRSIARELGADNICINAIAPGAHIERKRSGSHWMDGSWSVDREQPSNQARCGAGRFGWNGALSCFY